MGPIRKLRRKWSVVNTFPDHHHLVVLRSTYSSFSMTTC